MNTTGQKITSLDGIKSSVQSGKFEFRKLF